MRIILTWLWEHQHFKLYSFIVNAIVLDFMKSSPQDTAERKEFPIIDYVYKDNKYSN